MNFIRLAIFSAYRIHHIDHLIKYLLHNRIPQGILRQCRQTINQYSIISLFRSQRVLGMSVTRHLTGFAIDISFLQKWKNPPYRLMAQGCIVILECKTSQHGCHLFRYATDFSYLLDQRCIARLGLVSLV